MAEREAYIQVGVTALRDPVTGDFLPAVPLFIRAEDGARADEERLIADLGKLMAQRIARYQAASMAAGNTGGGARNGAGR